MTNRTLHAVAAAACGVLLFVGECPGMGASFVRRGI